MPLQVQYFQAESMPWLAAGRFPICSFPFLYGLAYLLPLELGFSVWFFLMLSRLELVIAAAVGYRQGVFPYLLQQELGAHWGVAAFVVWTARGHLRRVWQRAWGAREGNDAEEPMRYSVAFWGFVLGMLAMMAFATTAGLRPITALIYFMGLMGIVLAQARIRAEFGLPKVGLCCAVGMGDVMQRVTGATSWTPRDRTGMTLLWFLSRSHANFPILNEIDSFRIGDQSNISLPSLTKVIMATAIVGIVAAFWSMLHVTYQTGYESAKFMGPAVPAFGSAPWTKLANSLSYPPKPDIGASLAYILGIGFTVFLAAMRIRFIWWPFHPIGYLLKGSYEMLRLWFPIFITWLIKSLILRYGGMRLYRRAYPFFIGLILGEFVAGFLRTIVDLVLDLYLPAVSGLGGI